MSAGKEIFPQVILRDESTYLSVNRVKGADRHLPVYWNNQYFLSPGVSFQYYEVGGDWKIMNKVFICRHRPVWSDFILLKSVVRALFFCAVLSAPQGLHASSSAKLGETQAQAVAKATIDSDEEEKQRQTIAVMLAEYEIEGRKLLDGLDDKPDRNKVDQQAGILLSSGEKIMDWARFRLKQCDEYLGKARELKARIADITLEVLEKDYHHDGALPTAPPECYHVKDTFVHPATVLVLTRDDPALGEETITGIRAEILEVLGHTEVVRQLIVY